MSQGKRRYFVTLDSGDPVEVSLDYSAADGCWWAEVDGHRLALNLEALGAGGRVQAMVDGEAVDLMVSPGEEGEFQITKPSDPSVESVKVRARSDGEIILAAPSASTVERPKNPTVTCPITGEVLSIPVTVGQRVAEGEVLVMVEAMKMETLIKSPIDATVRSIHVAPGDRVKAGAELVSLES
jgi:pyruvate carboxylase